MGLFSSRARRAKQPKEKKAKQPDTDTASSDATAADEAPDDATPAEAALADAAPADTTPINTASVDGPPTDPAPRSSAPDAGVDGSEAAVRSVKDELQQLLSQRPSCDAFAEEAVKILAEVAKVETAAILTYEMRGNKLRGVASVGLKDDAVKALVSDVGSGWDIPLRSIRNRRINVIESANENPFVPDQIKAITEARLTIATIPFYHANSPMGVAVFFSPKPRAYSDDILRSLSQGLRVCAMAMHELPTAALLGSFEQPVQGNGDGKQPNLLRGLATLKTELARLTASLEESERLRANEAAERVTAQSFLKAMQGKRDEAESQVAELRALLYDHQQKKLPALEEEVGDLKQRLAAAVAGADEAQAHIRQLEESLQKNRLDAGAKGESIASLTLEREELERQLGESQATLRQRDEAIRRLEQRTAELEKLDEEAATLRGQLDDALQTGHKAETQIAELTKALAGAKAERTKTASELEESNATLQKTKLDHEKTYEDLLQSWEKIEKLEKVKASVAAEHDALLQAEKAQQKRADDLEMRCAALEADEREHAGNLKKLDEQVATLEAQRSQLHEELERIRNESGDTVNDLRTQLEERDRDRTELAEKLAALSRSEEKRRQLEARVSELDRDLKTARAEAQDVATRSEQHAQSASQLNAAKSELESSLEALFAEKKTLERETIESQAHTEEKIKELEEEIRRRDRQIELTKSELHGQLEGTVAEAEANLTSARKQLEEISRRNETLAAELDSAREDAAARDELLTTTEEEREKLATQFAKLSAERDKLDADLGETKRGLQLATHDSTNIGKQVAALESQLAALRDDQLPTVHAELETSERARKSAEETLQKALEQYELETRNLQDQVALYREEKEQLAKSLEEKDRLLQSAEQDLTTIDLVEHGEDEDLALEINRSGLPEEDADELEESALVPNDQIVVLDIDTVAGEATKQLIDVGHHVTAMTPNPDDMTSLTEQPLGCAAINLAAPSAWPTLRRMRNGAGVPQVPMIAYALSENAPKGFWLGPVDFLTLPVTGTKLSDVLKRMAPQARRVLGMSHDFDVMNDVRAQLSEVKISTAVVLDGKQALDLVSTVRPQAAVLHLSPNCTDVFRAIAGLRSNEETSNIPIIFLLDGEALEREEAFVTSGVRMLTGRGTLVPDDLGRSLASAIDSFQGMA